MEALLDRPMAKSKESYKTVKLRDDVYENARRVASLRRIDLMVYVSEALAPIAERDLETEARKLVAPKKSKPSE